MPHFTTSAWPGGLQIIIWMLIAEIPVIALLAYLFGLIRKLPGLAELEDQSVMEIIKRRYASGEITEEEMDKMVNKIKNT